MNRNIQAIFLDTGNTLRIVREDVIVQGRARREIARLVGSREDPEVLCARLAERYHDYKQWAKETLIQATEETLWTRWLLPEQPAESLTPLTGRLTRLWLDQDGVRVPRPDARQTAAELSRRGYQLGIIANSISRTEIPEWLEAEGLAPYFQVVVLSSVFGRRKPDPSIYIEAAQKAGLEPARCAYVGDNPSRDLLGARQAGFGMALILLEQDTLSKEPNKGRQRPDGILRECRDLLTFFPPRS